MGPPASCRPPNACPRSLEFVTDGGPPKKVSLCMLKLWYSCWHRLLTSLYFSRITLLHPERLPRRGPIFYLGLHRNGAVDGFVYRRVLRDPVFLISSQLRRSWLARLFFCGISVHRSNAEGELAENEAALQTCLELLRGGRELFIFPEGTSSLGPQHLPLKSGAAWLLLEHLQSGGPPIQVIPLGIHYECPWAFRSRVEVVVGEPISTVLPTDASKLACLKLLKRRFQSA